MLWQPSNKCTGYPFFRWSFSNLASQSFKCCQEFIDRLSIEKSPCHKLFKCHKHIYSECSGECTFDSLNISSLLSWQYPERAPIFNLKGRIRLTLSSSVSSQIISTCLSHSIIGSSNVTPPNSGIKCRSKGLLAIATGLKKSMSTSEFCWNSLCSNVSRNKKKIPFLSYYRSDSHSLHLLECLFPSLIPALYIELSNSPMQNTMHLHRQASYQSEFPHLPNSTHFGGIKSTDQLFTHSKNLSQLELLQSCNICSTN